MSRRLLMLVLCHTATLAALFVAMPAIGHTPGDDQPRKQPIAAQTKPVSEEPSLFRFKEGSKWGYMDASGRVIVPPHLTTAFDFSDGLAYVEYEKREAFINNRGKTAFTLRRPGPLQDAHSFTGFHDGMLAFAVGSRWGYCDRTGAVTVTPKYAAAKDFSEGLAAVNVGGSFVRDGMWPSFRGGKWGFVNKKGQLVIPARFRKVHSFSDGLTLVDTGTHYAFIDNSGHVRIDISDDHRKPEPPVMSAGSFSEGLARVDLAGNGHDTGYISKLGKLAIKPKFDGGRHFSEGLAAVRLGRDWGYIDHTGRLAIPTRFLEAWDFHDGRAAVRDQRGWHFIRKDGQALPCRPFNAPGDFTAGLARVHEGGALHDTYDGGPVWAGGAWYYVNRDGKTVRCAWRDED